MEKHTCKLCSKRFPTGRALGGHMRCHAAASSTSSDDAPPHPSEGWMQSYRLRENPRKSVRLADGHFSSPFAVAAFDAALDDGSYSIDSDAESHPTPDFHRQRSKRRRRSPPGAAAAAEPPEPVSSISNVTTEEDVAISLVLLSREAWAEQNEPITVSDDDNVEGGQIAASSSPSLPPRASVFDLNLPPPPDEAAELSAVFDDCDCFGN